MTAIASGLWTAAAICGVLHLPRTARAQETRATERATDSAAVVQVVTRFHAALAAGEGTAAASLLDSGAVVLESGDVETRAEYVRHHLPADIAFARATHATRRLQRVVLAPGAAWVVSTSRTTGRFEGRDVDSDGAELVVLRRAQGGWRIAAIHWSSHRHRP